MVCPVYFSLLSVGIANIIVAEKANRLDPTINMNFFRHFKICFAVTLVSCAVGAAMLYAIISLDNYLLS